jgi:hypothetical protein
MSRLALPRQMPDAQMAVSDLMFIMAMAQWVPGPPEVLVRSSFYNRSYPPPTTRREHIVNTLVLAEPGGRSLARAIERD